MARSYPPPQQSSPQSCRAGVVELQPATVGATRATRYSRSPRRLCVRHGLETVVGAELAVDVVQVVAECLGGNTEPAGDGRGVATLGKQLEDAALLLGERLDQIRPPDRVRTSRSESGIPPPVPSHRRVAASEPTASASVFRASRASSTSSMLRPSISLAWYPNSRSAALFQGQISPPSVTVYAASAVCSSSVNSSVSSIDLLVGDSGISPPAGQPDSRAQDVRLSIQYERFIVARWAKP